MPAKWFPFFSPKRCAIAVLLLASAFGAEAADLLTSYRDAAANDPQFAAAKATLAAAQERLPQGRAGLLPVMNLTANTTKNKVDYETRPDSIVPTEFNSNGWSLSLTQPLFRWQNWETYKQSEIALLQAEAQYAAAAQDLILRLTQTYFDVLLAQETVATVQAQKKAIAEQLAVAQRSFEIGTASITDADEARARYELATAQEIAAQNEVLVKRRALKLMTAKEPGELKALKETFGISTPQPANVAAWSEAAEQSNFAVVAAQANLAIAEREVAKQRAGHLPNVDLVASRGRASQGTTLVAGTVYPGNDTFSTTVGVQLSLPLFSGGATFSRSREAVALREKALADLVSTKQQAGQLAAAAYLGVVAGIAQVQAFEQSLVSSRSVLASNRLNYEVGMRTNIDVLNAQQQLYSTQRDLARARIEALAAQVRLKAAAATLSETDLAAINALLE